MVINKLPIKEVKQKHEQDWLQLPGVVSVGLALGEAGEQVIVIGVDEFNQDIAKSYPDTIEGYKLVVQQVGTPKIL